MKIGIIGAGNIGANAALLFVKAGHEVALSNSRGPESLKELVRDLGENAHALTVDEAAAFGEVVLLAVPWRNPEALPSPEKVAGKIVIDAMNPYGDNFSIIDLGNSTSSEETLKRLPGARLVKAFNTIWYEHLAKNGRTDIPVEERHAIFVSGDDSEAKATVCRLIEEIGFAPVDVGSLREGKLQEPNTPIYNKSFSGREAREQVAKLKKQTRPASE
jgi:8-hydroxy-5-deazaflavin:NADPH oxidoreductase